MFPHGFLDGLLKHGCLEQRRPIGYTDDSLIRLEHHPRHAYVELLARLQVEPEAAQHDGDEATRAGADNEIEVVAWFRYLVAPRSFAFDFDVGAVHQLLEDNDHGIAADPSTICCCPAGRVSDLGPCWRVSGTGPVL